MKIERLPLALLTLALGATAARAQVFVDNQTAIPSGNPANNSLSENVDFGDVDLDGDWDAIFADGGDAGNDQNRIWINLGGAQGGLVGIFLDETATRFPAFLDDSRDVEFADIDNDRDLDIYVSNTAQIVSQGNHWLVNQGLLQGGSLGFYADETAARWLNLGGAGSSISPGAVLGSGTFIDWSCDCDFGDLDNDGDLDLVHSSYGGAFSGGVPTRIFLNDGTGRFEEFNPSGFQVPGTDITDGSPALWCEGLQQANTTNSTGAFADIASSALDIDVGDIDGDFDLDILHGARQELPRMFQNRLEENGGTLGFRDVTTAVFPANYSTGNGHYEQEMGDLDGDGDLDVYGLNWEIVFGFDDVTFRNDGSGVFSKIQTLSNSGNDDNEGDFLDYDNDGDLDLFVANFSGSSRLYQNDGTGNLAFVAGGTSGLGTVANFVALDADCCDVDKDGDYDVFQSNDGGARNQYFQNTTNVPDTHAPYIPNVEDPGNQVAGPGVLAVRAQVYDNAPYYITWYNDTDVLVSVDGFELPAVAARSSAGQVFRAEVLRSLVGNVSLTWRSADEYGNTGTSAPVGYTATYGGTFQTLYGPASPDVNGNAPALRLLSLPIPGQTFHVGVEGPANQGCRVALAAAPQVPPVNVPQVGGFLNIDVFTAQVLSTINLGPTGKRAVPAFLPGNFVPGQKIWFQIQSVAQTPSGPSFSLSQGLELTVQ